MHSHPGLDNIRIGEHAHEGRDAAGANPSVVDATRDYLRWVGALSLGVQPPVPSVRTNFRHRERTKPEQDAYSTRTNLEQGHSAAGVRIVVGANRERYVFRLPTALQRDPLHVDADAGTLALPLNASPLRILQQTSHPVVRFRGTLSDDDVTRFKADFGERVGHRRRRGGLKLHRIRWMVPLHGRKNRRHFLKSVVSIFKITMATVSSTSNEFNGSKRKRVFFRLLRKREREREYSL